MDVPSRARRRLSLCLSHPAIRGPSGYSGRAVRSRALREVGPADPANASYRPSTRRRARDSRRRSAVRVGQVGSDHAVTPCSGVDCSLIVHSSRDMRRTPCGPRSPTPGGGSSWSTRLLTASLPGSGVRRLPFGHGFPSSESPEDLHLQVTSRIAFAMTLRSMRCATSNHSPTTVAGAKPRQRDKAVSAESQRRHQSRRLSGSGQRRPRED